MKRASHVPYERNYRGFLEASDNRTRTLPASWSSHVSTACLHPHVLCFYCLIAHARSRRSERARDERLASDRGKTLMRMQPLPIIGYEPITRSIFYVSPMRSIIDVPNLFIARAYRCRTRESFVCDSLTYYLSLATSLDIVARIETLCEIIEE